MFSQSQSYHGGVDASRDASLLGHERDRFRPVALPALAAAVHVAASAAKAARAKLVARQPRPSCTRTTPRRDRSGRRPGLRVSGMPC